MTTARHAGRLNYGNATPAEREEVLDGYRQAERDAGKGAYLSIGQLQVAGMSPAFLLGYASYVTDHPVIR